MIGGVYGCEEGGGGLGAVPGSEELILELAGPKVVLVRRFFIRLGGQRGSPEVTVKPLRDLGGTTPPLPRSTSTGPETGKRD